MKKNPTRATDARVAEVQTLNRENQSILFISLSCVGDAIMTTPVLEVLHEKFPGAVIDIVSDRRSSLIYTHCPYRGKIFLKDKKKFLRGSLDLLREVRRTEYDLIVDLRTDGIAWLCRGKKRLTKWGRRGYGAHAVQQLMGVVRPLHGEREIPETRIWLSADEHAFAEEALSALPPGRWLAMAPGNANPRKVWQAEKYAALANGLMDFFTGVILDGSPQEKAATAVVGRGLELPFVDLAGRTNLLQAAAVLKRAGLYVGGDSGLGHIAGAVRTPTVTFFSVDSPARVLPWGNQAAWLKSPDAYAGSIPLEEALREVRGLLTAPARKAAGGGPA